MGFSLPLLSGVLAGSSNAVRAIASGARCCFGLSDGTNTMGQCRSAHFNESGAATRTVQICYPGWYIVLPNEADTTVNYTVTASIEYPAGTFKQVTFSGSTSRVVVPTELAKSDHMAVVIPANAQFWVRTFVTVASVGQKWPIGPIVTSNTALGEGNEIGTALTDKTMGGTISTGGFSHLRPIAILGPYFTGMKKVSLMGTGDSIVFGLGDQTNSGVYQFDSRNNTGWVGRAASTNCPYISIALAAAQTKDQVLSGKMDRRLDYIRQTNVTHIVSNFGINDALNGRTFAQLSADLDAYWALLKAVPNLIVYQATIGPNSSTVANTRRWYRNSTQTATSYTLGSSSIVGKINAKIRASTVIDGYIEYSNAMSTAQDSGICINGDEQTSSNLLVSDNGMIIAPGTTATAFITNSTKGAGYYQGGIVTMTSGALSGQTRTIINNGVGTMNVVTFGSAPAAGDTCDISSRGVQFENNDGLHPLGDVNLATAAFSGGIPILRDILIPIIQGWNL